MTADPSGPVQPAALGMTADPSGPVQPEALGMTGEAPSFESDMMSGW